MKADGISLLFIIFFLCLGSCEEKKNDFPIIYTGKVTSITPEGATFNGRVIMPETNDDVEIGFCWSTNSSPKPDSDYQIIIENIDREGIFSYSVDYALIGGKKYYVRSYVTYNDITLFGETIEFTSLGAASPLISNVIPDEGWWTDTIKIQGDHFSTKLSDIKVYFENKEVNIIKCDLHNIFVEVPLVISTYPVPVKISVLGNETLDSLRFSIIPPEIHIIEPTEGNFGEAVSVKGKNFINRELFTNISGKAHYHSTEFFYSDVKLDVNIINDTLTEISMHHNIPDGEHVLTAKNGCSANGELTIYRNHKYSITDFSPDTAVFGDTILLYGNFYSGPAPTTSITVGSSYNKATNILSVTDSLISFILPPLYLEEENTINLTQNSASTASDKKLRIKPPVVKSIKPLKGIPGDTVTITGDNFHPDADKNEFYFGSVKSTICYLSTDTIKLIVPLVESGISEIRYTVKYLYDEIIAYFEILSPKIISVSHDTIRLGDRIIIEAENIPPDPSKMNIWLGTSFSPPQQELVNNTFYVDIPFKSTIHGHCDIKVIYGVMEDTWPVYSICPFYRLNGHDLEGSVTAWSINNEIPVVGYSRGGVYYKEYNIAENYWCGSHTMTYRFLFPVLTYLPASFTIDSVTYLGSGSSKYHDNAFNNILYRVNSSSYDSINQTPGPARRNTSSFVINDKGYFGSGYDSDGNELFDFWSYDPAGNEWIRISDFPAAGITSAFGHGNYGYALCMDGSFFRYDPSIDSWEELVPIPEYSSNMHGFGIDEAICVAVQSGAYVQIYAYNSLTENWVKKNQLLMADMKFTIEYDAEIYIHGHYYNFFKYDPKKDI